MSVMNITEPHLPEGRTDPLFCKVIRWKKKKKIRIIGWEIIIENFIANLPFHYVFLI